MQDLGLADDRRATNTKTLIALVVVLLASAALTADRNKLPVQFVGDWCLDNSGKDKEHRHIGWVDA